MTNHCLFPGHHAPTQLLWFTYAKKVCENMTSIMHSLAGHSLGQLHDQGGQATQDKVTSFSEAGDESLAAISFYTH